MADDKFTNIFDGDLSNSQKMMNRSSVSRTGSQYQKIGGDPIKGSLLKSLSDLVNKKLDKEADLVEPCDLEDMFNPTYNKYQSCFSEKYRNDIT